MRRDHFQTSDLIAESSEAESAHLRPAARPKSGAWLHALPSPVLRLGYEVCEPHTCICSVMVEAAGHHGLSCTQCAGRHSRHHAINYIIGRALVSAEIPCVLASPGLSRLVGKRPNDLFLAKNSLPSLGRYLCKHLCLLQPHQQPAGCWICRQSICSESGTIFLIPRDMRLRSIILYLKKKV